MNIGRSFTYITEDQDWIKKVLIAGLISLIPVVGQFYLMGYVLEVLRNVIAGREVPLPDATANFGDKLVKGLLLTAITFIYGLPIMLISACSGVGNSILANTVQDSDTFSTIMMVFGGCFGFVSLLYGIALGLLTPFIWSTFAETGQFGDAFKLNRIWAMFRSNIGQAIIVFLVCSVVGFVAGAVGFVLCIIGLVFTTLYAQLVAAFLYGSLYRQAKSVTL
jgi:hypothetical protein